MATLPRFTYLDGSKQHTFSLDFRPTRKGRLRKTRFWVTRSSLVVSLKFHDTSREGQINAIPHSIISIHDLQEFTWVFSWIPIHTDSTVLSQNYVLGYCSFTPFRRKHFCGNAYHDWLLGQCHPYTFTTLTCKQQTKILQKKVNHITVYLHAIILLEKVDPTHEFVFFY